jgi:hypothetical protein
MFAHCRAGCATCSKAVAQGSEIEKCNGGHFDAKVHWLNINQATFNWRTTLQGNKRQVVGVMAEVKVVLRHTAMPNAGGDSP